MKWEIFFNIVVAVIAYIAASNFVDPIMSFVGAVIAYIFMKVLAFIFARRRERQVEALQWRERWNRGDDGRR